MIGLLKAKSLKFWVALGLVIALTPLALSAGAGYFILNHAVIAPMHDVVSRQREQIIPAQHLRILIWDTLIPVDEYVEESNPVQPEAYRGLRTQIESRFAGLIDSLQGEGAIQKLVQRARENWSAADGYATELISVPIQSTAPGAVETMQRFHGAIAAASDRLEAVSRQLDGAIRNDHDRAVLAYERSMWIAGIAGSISLLSAIWGTMLIGRIMSGSVDRLVDGAARFAGGDRQHRIEVQVPPELRRVADEFNHMIGRIQKSEEILGQLAHLDSLTGLSNRRAFDEAFADAQSRLQRFGEPSCLLAIDIDHFKRVNDSNGHAAGDEVLRTVAKVMTRNIRPFDSVFRIGGEEFAVLTRRAGVAEAREAAERIRDAIASTPVPVDDVDISLTVSIGIAGLTGDCGQAVTVETADAALYRAKTGGRNRVVVGGTHNSAEQDAARGQSASL